MNEQDMIEHLEATGDYRVLRKVPSRTVINTPTEGTSLHRAMVIDLETMGVNAKSDKIIELGLLCFTFGSDGVVYEVTDTMNQLQDPGEPIPDLIKQITGITDHDVKNQSIDWDEILGLLNQTDLCIAHNASFDREFLEGPHVPEHLREVIMKKPFACSQKDVDWRALGFESVKLEYLNFRSGYFYGGHRALNDCEATLNILIENEGAFETMLNNVRRPSYLFIALDAPFDKKDLLKERHYRWSSGGEGLPKGWWTTVRQDQWAEEQSWLNERIYRTTGHAETLPRQKITARTRYSSRAYRLECNVQTISNT